MKKKCPLCNGCGEVEVEITTQIAHSELVSSAKRMRKEGMTIREIAKVLGKKNPGSVSHLLSQKSKQ